MPEPTHSGTTGRPSPENPRPPEFSDETIDAALLAFWGQRPHTVRGGLRRYEPWTPQQRQFMRDALKAAAVMPSKEMAREWAIERIGELLDHGWPDRSAVKVVGGREIARRALANDDWTDWSLYPRIAPDDA